MEVTTKQSTPSFPKKKHFLPPNTRTYVKAKGGNNKTKHAKFSEKETFLTP